MLNIYVDRTSPREFMGHHIRLPLDCTFFHPACTTWTSASHSTLGGFRFPPPHLALSPFLSSSFSLSLSATLSLFRIHLLHTLPCFKYSPMTSATSNSFTQNLSVSYVPCTTLCVFVYTPYRRHFLPFVRFAFFITGRPMCVSRLAVAPGNLLLPSYLGPHVHP